MNQCVDHQKATDMPAAHFAVFLGRHSIPRAMPVIRITKGDPGSRSCNDSLVTGAAIPWHGGRVVSVRLAATPR